jgi:hypothetical protein
MMLRHLQLHSFSDRWAGRGSAAGCVAGGLVLCCWPIVYREKPGHDCQHTFHNHKKAARIVSSAWAHQVTALHGTPSFLLLAQT